MTFTIICSDICVKAIIGTTQVFKVWVLTAFLLVRAGSYLLLWSTSRKLFTFFQTHSWLLLKQNKNALFLNICFLLFTEAFLPKCQIPRISFAFHCAYINNKHPSFTLSLLFTLSSDFFCPFRRYIFTIMYLFNICMCVYTQNQTK